MNDAPISSDIRAFFAKTPTGRLYLAEAEFGLKHVAPYLDGLPAGARVLEVGSGPCIVLASLTNAYPHLHLEGIEPMGSGFALFEDFIVHLRQTSTDAPLFEGGYEAFRRTGDWDLIFLVNVFEHLPDWRDFLGFVHANLRPGGRCVVLCPNYGFPYESHFRIPVIGGKAMTRRLFETRIDVVEKENDWTGLYESLNFVTLRQVRVASAEAGLNITVHTSIVAELIDRLDTDPEFLKRQRAISSLARALKRSGMLDWLLACRSFQNFLPYMKFELTRKV